MTYSKLKVKNKIWKILILLLLMFWLILWLRFMKLPSHLKESNTLQYAMFISGMPNVKIAW